MSKLIAKFDGKALELSTQGGELKVSSDDDELAKFFSDSPEVVVFDPFQLRERKVKPQKSLLDAFIWIEWLKEHNPERQIVVSKIPREVKDLLQSPEGDVLF